MNRFKAMTAAAILAVPMAAPYAAAQDVRLDRSEAARVDRGDIVLREVAVGGGKGKCFEAIGLIEAAPEKVYGVLTDLEAYADFMPNVHTVTVRERSVRHAVADYVLRLPLGRVKKYRLRLTFHPEVGSYSISWRKVDWPGLAEEETIRDTSGYWLLRPYPAGSSRTLALYRLYTDPGPVPPGLGWIIDHLSRRSLPETIAGTRVRVAGSGR